MVEKVTPVGFESTPFRNGALSQRLRPLGQSVIDAMLSVRKLTSHCLTRATYALFAFAVSPFASRLRPPSARALCLQGLRNYGAALRIPMSLVQIRVCPFRLSAICFVLCGVGGNTATLASIVGAPVIPLTAGVSRAGART